MRAVVYLEPGVIELREVAVPEIEPGDLLLIRQGDVVPVDGLVASDAAFVDTSALTGEEPQPCITHAMCLHFHPYTKGLDYQLLRQWHVEPP